jgi:hypothetical protein
LKGSSEFGERKFFTLLGSGRKFSLKISENLVLESRLASDEIFDRLGEGNVGDLLLELLSDDRSESVDGLERFVGDSSGSSSSSTRGSRERHLGSSGSSSSSRSESDSSVRSVSLSSRVDPSLGFTFVGETFGGFLSESEEENTVDASGTETERFGEVSLNGRETETSGHLGSDHARDETSRVLAEFARVSRLESGTEFSERHLLSLFRSRGEFSLKVSEDFVLKGRLSSDKFLDSLGERNLRYGFLELLSDDDSKGIDSLEGLVGDG